MGVLLNKMFRRATLKRHAADARSTPLSTKTAVQCLLWQRRDRRLSHIRDASRFLFFFPISSTFLRVQPSLKHTKA